MKGFCRISRRLDLGAKLANVGTGAADVLLRPSKEAGLPVPFEIFGANRYLAEGKTLKELLATVYSQEHFSQAKLTFLAPLPDGRFDCIVTLQTNLPEALESAINKQFHLVTQYQNTDTGSVGSW